MQRCSNKLRKLRSPNLSVGLFAVLVAIALAAVPAFSHTDPALSNSTGISISLTAFVDTDGDLIGETPVLSRTTGSQVLQGETLYYVATLSPNAQPPNAAFEGGTWSITLPDGSIVDVTPGGGIPCIGGTTDDVAAPGGRGDCDPNLASLTSVQVPYVVDCGDEVSGVLGARTDYVDGFAHIGAGDVAGVGAFTPFPLDCVSCDIRVDKQISCDGENFVDVGLGLADDDGVNGCTALEGDDVIYRYAVSNPGEVGLTDCVLTDSNGLVFPPNVPLGLIGIGQTSTLEPDFTAQCTDELETGEPNTATLTCQCGEDFTVQHEVVATDAADVTCASCEVEITKEVSCDFGATFGDGCVGWNESEHNDPEPVIVRWTVGNIGDVDVACNPTEALPGGGITDDNPGILLGSLGIGGLTTGQTGVIFTDDDQDCSDELAGNEPNTSTLTCDCLDPEGLPTGEIASAIDTNDFQCQTPGLEVTKVCETQDAETNTFLITASNTGTANLINCTVTDEYFEDSTCPANNGSPLAPQEISPTAFDLNVGASQPVNGAILGLLADACNTVEVSCEIEGAVDEAGAPKRIAVNADDTCEVVGDGCLTRTPGFWGTHPEITSQFLAPNCGIEITNVMAGVEGSAIEDMCSVGQDPKTNKVYPQQVQLERQCMAAQLNLTATAANEGSCNTGESNVELLVAECCTNVDSVCVSSLTPGDVDADNDRTINDCIADLDAFNNSVDTLETPDLFQSPGPADPTACQDSKNNGFLNSRPRAETCKGKNCP